MVRVITQETYDEVVKENMEEFDMSPEEAVQEAVAQFEAQGVDLSNIIKDLALGSGDDHLVTTTVMKLKEISSKKIYEDEIVFNELKILKAECNKDLAHRVKAAKDGAYEVLIKLLDVRLKNYLKATNTEDKKFIIAVLDTLTALMDTQPDLLDERGTDLIKSVLDNVQDEDILMSILKWTGTCCVKHEINRQRIFAKNITQNLKNILNLRSNVKLIIAVLQVIRKFTLDDDIRQEFGKAHEHARELGSQMIKPITDFLRENEATQLTPELLLTLTVLLVRAELCAMAAENGLKFVFDIAANYFDNEVVILLLNKLIVALCGSDDVKRELVKNGLATILISLLQRYSSKKVTAGWILKSISSVSLREVNHSKEFIESGAPEAIVQCMKTHPDDATVQQNGCWAIRNIVARYREQNSKFHELGAEEILNNAYNKFAKDFGYDIKSALRDLECDVKMEEQWKGRGVQLE